MQTATATLAVEGARAVAAFRTFAEGNGRPVATEGDGIRITLMKGDLHVAPEGQGAEVTLRCEDAAGLQMVRDLLAERLAGMGVTPDWHDDLAGRQPGNQARAEVLSVTRLSPRYSRVVMEGADLTRFATGPLHFRLLFGPEGADWPLTDATGATDWPGGMAAWHRPVYTTREIVVGEGRARITFDVFRHEGGRVTEWCDRVKPGDRIALTGPGGSSLPEPIGWMGLVGDETAVPVMARILANLPAEARGEARLIVPTAADMQDIACPAGVALHWHLRDAGETPLTALKALAMPEADRHVFFAGERTEAQEARERLSGQGLTRDEFRAVAYWGL